MKHILEDLRLLRSDGNNPNRMSNKQKEELWKSLQEFGWTDPILTNKDGVYADGEQRVCVCIAHGEFWAPVFRMDLSDVQRRRLRLLANELRGKHNRELEEAEWQRIIESGQRVELESLLTSVGEKLPEDLGGPRERSMLIPESYELVIECKDETDQKAKFDQLTAQGYAVRVLNL
jgi:ParB-like chromosome segregation protein Spo0J